jgi:hypothetical protein
MATAREFQEFADECMRWAVEARTEDQRQAFLQMASAWTQAALRLEGVLIPDTISALDGDSANQVDINAPVTVGDIGRP